MKAIRRATATDMLLLFVIAAIWASAFIAIKVAVPETGPLWLAALRVIIGALVLAPYAFFTGMQLPGSFAQWRLVVIMSLFNVVFPFFLISWAELSISAGVTSLLMGMGPFMALIGSHFLTQDDRITPQKLVAVLLGFSGIVILVGWDALSQIGTGHTLAQLAALGGSVCYVTAGLIIRQIDLPAAPLSFLALAIGSCVLFPAALLIDGMPRAVYTSDTLWALLYLGLLPTGLAYIMRFHLIRTVGFATFSLSTNIIPVIGIFLGVVLLGEEVRPQVLIALTLVVTGLFIARLKLPRQTAKS